MERFTEKQEMMIGYLLSIGLTEKFVGTLMSFFKDDIEILMMAGCLNNLKLTEEEDIMNLLGEIKMFLRSAF